MRRLAIALVLAVSSIGCSSAPTPTNRVALGTWPAGSAPGCVLMGIQGELVADPKYGTAIAYVDATMPVLWPEGFIGERVGSEIQVLNKDGRVIAVTGGMYEVFYSEVGFTAGPGVTIRSCGDARALPDELFSTAKP